MAVEKYSFLVAYRKKVYLNELHMSQQYIVGNREGKDEERGERQKREKVEKAARSSLRGHINRSLRCKQEK